MSAKNDNSKEPGGISYSTLKHETTVTTDSVHNEEKLIHTRAQLDDDSFEQKRDADQDLKDLIKNEFNIGEHSRKLERFEIQSPMMFHEMLSQSNTDERTFIQQRQKFNNKFSLLSDNTSRFLFDENQSYKNEQ